MRRDWEPLRPAGHVRTPDGRVHPNPGEFWLNRIYQVEVNRHRDGSMVLSIKPRDGSARHDWREFQLIKNDVAGPEREAIELYPAESRLVDTANQFFLWVSPEGRQYPIGFEDREVAEERVFPTNTQRPWPRHLRPADLRTAEQLLARHRDDPRVRVRRPHWDPAPEPGRETVDAATAARLCEVYFNIAAEVLGEDEVRRRRDAAIGAEAAAAGGGG